MCDSICLCTFFFFFRVIVCLCKWKSLLTHVRVCQRVYCVCVSLGMFLYGFAYVSTCSYEMSLVTQGNCFLYLFFLFFFHRYYFGKGTHAYFLITNIHLQTFINSCTGVFNEKCSIFTLLDFVLILLI